MNKNERYSYWAGYAAAVLGIASYGFTIISGLLRITGVIHLSWWWITAPIWIPFGIIVILICVWLIFRYWMEKANNDLNEIAKDFDGLSRSSSSQAADFQHALLHSLEVHGEAVTTDEMISQHFGNVAMFKSWAKRNNLIVNTETPHRYALTRRRDELEAK